MATILGNLLSGNFKDAGKAIVEVIKDTPQQQKEMENDLKNYVKLHSGKDKPSEPVVVTDIMSILGMGRDPAIIQRSSEKVAEAAKKETSKKTDNLYETTAETERKVDNTADIPSVDYTTLVFILIPLGVLFYLLLKKKKK
jgi:hypothetical protein